MPDNFLETYSWDYIDNFLDEDHYQEILKLSETNKDWINTSTFWPEVLYDFDGVKVKNNVIASKDDWIDSYKWDKGPIGRFQNKLIDYLRENNVKTDRIITQSFWTRIYKYPEHSSLYWHDDSLWGYGFTYYLIK